MRKAFTTIFMFFTSLSLLAQSGTIVLSGQVKNQTSTSIVISHLDNQELVSTELDADGRFSMSAQIEDGYYLLEYGRYSTYVYLYPDDKINLVFDAGNFEGTLVFDGQGSERNNYLTNKSKVHAQLTQDLEAFYQKDEVTYLENLKKLKNTHANSLSNYDVESFFKIDEVKSLEYERLLSIQNYKSNIEFYLGDEISPSEDFYKPLEILKLDNEKDYRKQPYFRYLVNSIWNKRIEEAHDVEGMLEVLRQVPSQTLAIDLITGFYSKISSDKERSKDYLDLIKRVTNHKPFVEASEKQYQETLKAQGLKPGDTSPKFKYESIDGKKVSLNDLKGKYVYIDVWATWCAPCIKQVPYLKQLEERYHDKNIVFVSISVDKEEVKPTWKKMVANKELGGLQLFADKSFESAFMDAYAVNSIPRFILIDPEGKVVDAEAPRPSFDKTKVLLDGLLD